MSVPNQAVQHPSRFSRRRRTACVALAVAAAAALALALGQPGDTPPPGQSGAAGRTSVRVDEGESYGGGEEAELAAIDMEEAGHDAEGGGGEWFSDESEADESEADDSVERPDTVEEPRPREPEQPAPAPGPPQLSVAPDPVNLPPNQYKGQFIVANVGEENLTWTALAKPSVTLSDTGTSPLAGGQQAMVTFIVDATTLGAGPFTFNIKVTGNGGTEYVTVRGSKTAGSLTVAS